MKFFEQSFENLMKEKNGLFIYSDIIRIGYSQR